MKRLLLIVFLSSFSWGLGQNLSLQNLITLRTMDLEDAEIMLTEKGWEYTKSEKEEYGVMATLEFTYKKNSNNSENPAVVHKYYSAERDRVSLFIFSQSKYLEYIKSLKVLKTRLLFNGNNVGDFFKVYQGASTTFIIRTSTYTNQNGETKPSWKLSIWSNNDFATSQIKKDLLD